ncbi:hypothetical protein [Dyella amyloliquefaciens]|uniref:hypothetical protein n=1 Tax=Dyella amyloliquefaciens TaxID=1770545 RepID=UPI00102E6225|nr:hypothetical protein [Dyella amyloliquefaciens]
MTSLSTRAREGTCRRPPVSPSLRAWSRWFGVVFAVVTFVSMLMSAEWRWWMVLADPLAWMMLILAAAAGVTAGYALGCRVQAWRPAA